MSSNGRSSSPAARELGSAGPARKAFPGLPAETLGVQVGAEVSLEALENEHIARVIQHTATMEEAAKVLGIDPATLYRKRKR